MLIFSLSSNEYVIYAYHFIYNLIFSDSTLYGVWSNIQLSFNCEVIPGAKYRDLAKVISHLYLRQSSAPLDVVIIGGLNNIIEGQSMEEIMEEVRLLAKRLERHSQSHRHSLPSTVSFATIPLAPKLAVLYESPAMARPLISSFTDKSSIILQTNDALKNYNLFELKVKFVGLNSFGVKKCSKTDRLIHILNLWKEQEVNKKLHLVMPQKVKMVKFITKYFANI